MNYLIIGAGAIGTYIGGSLLRSGQTVTFLERQELLQKLKSDGLSINLEEDLYRSSNIQVYSDFSEATASEPIDVVIFAMKSFDTDSVAKMIAVHSDKFKVVLCLQNGVENEQTIARHLSEDRVIGGSVTSAVERIDSGQATLERKRGIAISNSHPLSHKIVDDFNGAGLNAVLLPKSIGNEMVKDALQSTRKCYVCYFKYDPGRNIP